MFDVLRDPAIYEHENRPPPSLEWLRTRFARLETRLSPDGAQQWLNWVVFLPPTTPIGYVQATVYASHRAAIAYELNSRYWGMGLGSAAVSLMITELVAHYGVETLTAVLKRTNRRSRRLLERNGFEIAREGLQRECRPGPDELLMTRRAAPDPDSEPVGRAGPSASGSAVETITLKSSDELRPVVERVLAGTLAELTALLPDAELHHIGATAIPGALTKGDVDVLVRVPATQFPQAVQALTPRFAVKQPENWTGQFASFGDDDRFELPLGIQVVVCDSESDIFLHLRDHLIGHPAELQAYNRAKLEHAPEGPERYWEAKDALFTRILAARGRDATG